MKKYKRLLSETSIEATADDRCFKAVLSSSDIADDGHRILGWDLSRFEPNPVLQFGHSCVVPSVGNVKNLSFRNGVLKGTICFAPEGIYDLADTLCGLYRAGVMRALSVGFRPKVWRYSKDPKRSPGSMDIDIAELDEVSLVPIGADPTALVEARSAGLNINALSAWAQSASTKGQPAQRKYARALVTALAAPPRAPAPPLSIVDELAAREKRRAYAREKLGHFENFGEYVRALVDARNNPPDPRLLRAPTGGGETSPTLGGFAVPEGFADVILTTLYEDRTSILNYVQRFNIPDGTNSLHVSGVDETSRANGYRWGNVVADFADEGAVETPGFPKLKATQFATEKIIGFVQLTNELMADARNLETFLRRALVDELKYKLEQYIFSSAGTGVGRPLSILNSSALVTVAKTSGQTSGTLTSANLRAMRAALPAGSRRRAIWATSESLLESQDSIEEITFPQAGCANPDDLPRIMGRPVIETDVLPAIGTPGDVLLIDPAWYGFASKPMFSALSADVLFASDQAVLRVTWRCDAKPLVSTPITATDGASRSAFVALAQR